MRITIDIPDGLWANAAERMKERQISDPPEYLLQLLEADQYVSDELENALEEGAKGPFLDGDNAYWAKLLDNIGR